jgi:hypothetical protein
MEAEVVALSSFCRKLFPIINLVNAVGAAVELVQKDKPKMHITFPEDNSGALVLALSPPPQSTPQSKHYAIKKLDPQWTEHDIKEVAIKKATTW